MHSKIRLRLSAGVTKARFAGEGNTFVGMTMIAEERSKTAGRMFAGKDIINRFKADISSEMTVLFRKRNSIVFEDRFDRN